MEQTLSERTESLRREAMEAVGNRHDDVAEAEGALVVARAALGAAFADALALGIDVEDIADMASVSGSTVRKYAAASKGVGESADSVASGSETGDSPSSAAPPQDDATALGLEPDGS